MRAYIFPGQGSQYTGMGKELASRIPQVQELFRRADEILTVPLSKICFEGPDEELKQTKNTQPAIFLHSMALWFLLRPADGSMTAGHSLGEYSALVASGAIRFEDGLRLVRKRGELMQKAGEENPGTMAAVMGLDHAAIVNVCAEASQEGIVQPANFNAPGQIVISGSLKGVRRAMEIARQRGAKLVKELVVSGAFHSPLMQSAKDGLLDALGKVPMNDAALPVYANVTAAPVRSIAEIRTLLAEQVTKPVRWEESVLAMVKDGADEFIEIGPGKILQSLVKRISGTVKVSGVDVPADVDMFLQKQ